MNNRTDKYFIRVFQDLHKHLTTRGLKHNYMRLDNESYQEFKALLKDKNIDRKLAPPDMHTHNVAERSIRTFKYYFTAGLCTTDPDFLMKNWDRPLEQEEITLNLLHPSRLNPRL